MKTDRQSFLRYQLLVNIFVGVITLVFVIRMPSDPKNAWFLGFSTYRIFIVFSILLVIFALIWLTTHFWLKTKTSNKIEIKIGVLSTRSELIRICETGFVLVVVFCSWFLTQWLFLGTDQQITSILQRATPVVVFGFVLCTQVLFFIRKNFVKESQEKLIFNLIILGGYILLLWSFVGEFYLSDYFFPDYYVVERFGETFQTWMPLILFQTVIGLQLVFYFKYQISLNLNIKWLYIFILVISGYFYHISAVHHAEVVNTDIQRSDQSVYVEFTRKVAESGFVYTGERNQTPGYPFFQAIFCGGKKSNETIFSCGKQVNIVLSEVLLLLIFLIVLKINSFEHAFLISMVTGFSLFLFKSGYYTVELFYYFMIFVGFILMCKMLIKPSSSLGIITGIILGVALLLKNAILPGFVLFLLIYVIVELNLIFQKNKTSNEIQQRKFKWRHISAITMVIAGFLGVIYPYIRENKVVYGHYFYNVNTTFYIWYDSWVDAMVDGHKYGFRDSWPDLPPDELPGIQKYLREHLFSDIVDRFTHGLSIQIAYLKESYGSFNYLMIYSLTLVILLVINAGQISKLIRRHWVLIMFLSMYILGYIFLFAWYTPIASGPRFFLSLFLPILIGVFTAIKLLINENHFMILGHKIEQEKFFSAINMVVLALVISDAYLTITKIMPNGYFGS